MEDRGIGKGFGGGKDLEPMKETQTRWIADVKMRIVNSFVRLFCALQAAERSV